LRMFSRLISITAIGLALGSVTSSSAAAKNPPKLSRIEWQTRAVSPTTEDKPAPIVDKQPLLFTQIVPVSSFKSPADMDTGGNIIPTGAAIVRTANDPERFCEPMRRRKQPQIYCVADTDADGTLDVLYVIPTVSISGQVTTNYEFFIGTMRLYSGRPLRVLVPKSALIPDPEPKPLDVVFSKTGKTSFSLCIYRYTGSSWIDGMGYAGFCGPRWDVKDAVFPATLRTNGGSIILSKSDDGQYFARIISPPVGKLFPNEE
jgi:hypothetical protein